MAIFPLFGLGVSEAPRHTKFKEKVPNTPSKNAIGDL